MNAPQPMDGRGDLFEGLAIESAPDAHLYSLVHLSRAAMRLRLWARSTILQPKPGRLLSSGAGLATAGWCSQGGDPRTVHY